MVLKTLRGNEPSFRAMARRMGVSHSTVQKVERSKNPGILTLYRYAKALGVPFMEVAQGYIDQYEKSLQNH